MFEVGWTMCRSGGHVMHDDVLPSCHNMHMTCYYCTICLLHSMQCLVHLTCYTFTINFAIIYFTHLCCYGCFILHMFNCPIAHNVQLSLLQVGHFPTKLLYVYSNDIYPKKNSGSIFPLFKTISCNSKST